MTYRLADDIDPTERIDVRVVDEKMARLLADAEFAFTRQTALSPELKTLVADLLRVFITTHQSMRELIAKEKKNPLLFGDAGSLCREQVEKLYMLALVIDKQTSGSDSTYVMTGKQCTSITCWTNKSTLCCRGFKSQLRTRIEN